MNVPVWQTSKRDQLSDQRTVIFRAVIIPRSPQPGFVVLIAQGVVIFYPMRIA
jgi:hypothetical protein